MIVYEPHRANPPGGIYHQWDANLCFSPHLHDSFEFIYVYEGQFSILVDSRLFSVQAGQAILIFPNQIHAVQAHAQSQTYLCIFQNSLVGEFYQVAKHSEASSPVFSISDPRLIEALSKSGASRYQLKALLYDMIHQFDKACGPYRPRSVKPASILGKILVFIANHYTENINMQTIALALGYDHHYLSNVCQKYLHTTFRTILNEYRISQAKYRLLSSQATIACIGYECGYESIGSFNRNFKRIAGMTPSEFRKNVSDAAPPNFGILEKNPCAHEENQG